MPSVLSNVIPFLVNNIENPISSILCFLDICTVVNNSAAMRSSTMIDRLDAVDVDDLFKNTRLFNSYVKCILDTGPCTAEGKELKREVLLVLHTGCADCSQPTKERLKKTFITMRSDARFRESYKKVLQKYDPDKKYIANLEQLLLT